MFVDDLVKRQISIMPAVSSDHIANAGGEPLDIRPVLGPLLDNALRFLHGGSDNDRFHILPGLRGVGKTTFLHQLYQKLIAEGVGPKRVLYLPCDRLTAVANGTVSEALDRYQDALGRMFPLMDEKVFILLDEAQYEPLWGVSTKVEYDESRNVFFVVTGSSALALNMNPDVARRAVLHKVPPIGFGEFLRLQGHGLREGPPRIRLSSLKDAGAAADMFGTLEQGIGADLVIIPDTKRLMQRFLLAGGLPGIVREREASRAWMRLLPTLERITTVDLPAMGGFDHDTARAALSVITLVADSPDRSIQRIAAELSMPAMTVRSLLHALVRTELILEVPAIGSTGRATRRKKRHYFTTPSVMAAVLDAAGIDPVNRIGFLLECAVSNVLERLFDAQLRYDPHDGGADLILDGAVRAAVEVGWGGKGEKQVLKSMREHELDWGMVISDRALVERKGKVVHVPAQLFLALT